MFGDEASFWLDGSLHRTWARVGVQPHVDTYGMRKTAHVFGALSLERQPQFEYLFAPVFNGETFLLFLQQLVARSTRKLFLIVDNGPCHNLKQDGKAWLARNRGRIELFRLPPYSPNDNPTEGACKETQKRTTHHRFFHSTEQRDTALVATRYTSNRWKGSQRSSSAPSVSTGGGCGSCDSTGGSASVTGLGGTTRMAIPGYRPVEP
jgi:transposase